MHSSQKDWRMDDVVGLLGLDGMGWDWMGLDWIRTRTRTRTRTGQEADEGCFLVPSPDRFVCVVVGLWWDCGGDVMGCVVMRWVVCVCDTSASDETDLYFKYSTLLGRRHVMRYPRGPRVLT